MATIIDKQKLWDAVHEGNCIVCDYVIITQQETPEGSVPVINCNASKPEDCYVVRCEVERLTPPE